MVVAETLGKFEHEVLELSPNEFSGWCAYLRIQGERQHSLSTPSTGSRGAIPRGYKRARAAPLPKIIRQPSRGSARGRR